MIAFLKSFDSFGQPYSLNLKGSDTHKTKLGAVVTLVIYTLVLAFFVVRFLFMVQKSEPRIFQVQQAVDLETHPDEYNFMKNNFTLGISAYMVTTDMQQTKVEPADIRLLYDIEPFVN
jgi:hypothetical protein